MTSTFSQVKSLHQGLPMLKQAQLLIFLLVYLTHVHGYQSTSGRIMYSQGYKKVNVGCKYSDSRCKLRMAVTNSISPNPILMQNSLYIAVNKFASGPKPLSPEDAIEIDPKTAGMSPDEITNYMSNVGGGLCGYPEALKSIVGLGLNLNLLVFGVFCVSYAILSALDFKSRKDVEDIMGMSKEKTQSTSSVASGGREFKSGIRMPNSGVSAGDDENDDMSGFGDNNIQSPSAGAGGSQTGNGGVVGNRAERRLRGRK